MKINNKQFFMSSSPHIHTVDDTRSIMTDVIIALAFPLIMAIYFFGFRALVITVISVASAVFFEALFCKLTKKALTIRDLSAVVTGILVALCLPVAVPLWMPVVGSFFAIVIVKNLYGGLGKNFLNPALSAQAFLFSWPALMSLWTKPSLGKNAVSVFGHITRENLAPDVIASVTPLAKMKLGNLPVTEIGEVMRLRDVAMGNIAGAMGEVSAVVIIAALIYLLVRRVITLHIPAAYILTVAFLTFVFPRGENPALWSLYSVLSGGLLFGAVFMATDYTTSPTTPKGRIVYGIGCGVITVLLRYFGAYNEGVTFAILTMNLMTFFIERVCRPRRFGLKKEKAGAEHEE